MAAPGSIPPVLVVDDDKSSLKFVSTILKKEGIPSVESDNGYAAFAFLEKQLETGTGAGIVGIVSDWKMPGWDGLKLLAELRRHPVLKDVPFILMSGAVTKPELEAAAKSGANGVLLKPFERDTLLGKVRDVFYDGVLPAPSAKKE